MTHDPLCPYEPKQSFHCCTPQTILCLAAHTTPGISCQCDLIAKVRSDERQQAAVRVEKNVLVGMTLIPKEVRMVLDAVRSES